jgi:carboxylesterase type B
MFLQTVMQLSHTAALAIVQPNLPIPLLEHYGLSRSQTAHVTEIGQIIPGLGAFLNDYLFASPSNRTAHALTASGTKVYTYCFDRTNTFQSPFNGIAHHALDLIYVFGNFMDAFSDKKDVEMSHGIMKKWIDFANGKEPWEPFSSGKAIQFTTEAELVVRPFKEITSRRWDAFPEMEKDWDLVKKFGDILNGAKPDPMA